MQKKDSPVPIVETLARELKAFDAAPPMGLQEVRNRMPPSKQYRSASVEPLLYEAAALADRCIDLKHTLDELWVAWANQSILLESDRRADSLAELEDSDDVKGPTLASAAERRLEWLRGIDGRAAIDVIPELRIAPGRDAIPSNLPNNLAQLSSIGRALNAPDDGQTKNQTPATFSGSAIVAQAALSAVELGIRRDDADQAARMERNALARRKTARSDACDIRSERRKLTNEGPLDYKNRITRLIRLIVPSLSDAHERCIAARTGMHRLFGWSVEDVPALTGDGIEDLAIWIRQQTSALSKFSQLDQGFTVTLSLAHEGVPLELGRWMSVPLPSERLGGYSHCRLRGIAAFVEGDDPSAIYTVSVRPPSWAEYVNEMSSPIGEPVDQSGMPSCVLGRVMGRNAARPPEVGGTVSLVNASPIASREYPGGDGDWRVKIQGVAGASINLRDVQIELSIVGQPLINTGMD